MNPTPLLIVARIHLVQLSNSAIQCWGRQPPNMSGPWDKSLTRKSPENDQNAYINTNKTKQI